MPRVVLGEPDTVEMATVRQLQWLRHLVVVHDTGTMDVSKVGDPSPLTKEQASAGIDWLLKRPKVAVKPVSAAMPAAKALATKAVSPSKESRPTDPGYYVWSAEVTGTDENDNPIGDLYLRAIVNVKTERLNYHHRTPLHSDWEYVQYATVDALVRKYGEPDRMSLADIAAYGHASEFCLCCGRELSNPESLAIGIGPTCLDKGQTGGMF